MFRRVSKDFATLFLCFQPKRKTVSAGFFPGFVGFCPETVVFRLLKATEPLTFGAIKTNEIWKQISMKNNIDRPEVI